MNDLTPIPQKDFYAMMAGMLGNTAPPVVPLMDYQRGIIHNAIHNIRLGQMVKTSEREKIVAINQSTQATARVEQMVVSMTAQARLVNEIRKHEDEDKMRKELLREVEIRNQTNYFDMKISEMEYKKRKKEFEEEYGDGTKPS
jgi:hypothetical protein